MKLISVNVSQPKEIRHNGQTIKTGIFKEPAARSDDDAAIEP